ncbi:hypothetical protein BST97_02915 [Nonlabens spongiae]|uniref:Uncharacterized protein n=1 Tax=Nonlabens spongiae TaxID=331648 RepID=A0A1W6MHG7_9FLAO|nr:hypothetical protein [Nonlabens spongiae]ARN77035.1 hypothetical protein BST97_02915 [Nonlabens spongiae]
MPHPIKIEITDIDAFYRKAEKHFVQNFYSSKNLTRILLFAGLGLVLVIYGLWAEQASELTTVNHGQESVTYVDFGIAFGLGIGFLLYATLNFLDLRKSKKATEQLFELKRNREKKVNDKITFTFSESHISYSSSLHHWSKKWGLMISSKSKTIAYSCLLEPRTLLSLN